MRCPTTAILALAAALLLAWRSSDDVCTMRIVDISLGGAAKLSELLAASAEPVIVRSLRWEPARVSMADFEARHGDVTVRVVSDQQVTNNESPAAYETSLRDYAAGVRAGLVPKHDYVFTSVGNTTVARDMPELCDVFAETVCRQASRMPPPGMPHAECTRHSVARGSLSLLYGGGGSGNGLHEHGPALNFLLAGEKHWVVKRPDSGLDDAEAAALLPSPTEHADQAGAAAWLRTWARGLWGSASRSWRARHVWQCRQTVGDLVWVPSLLSHATSNEVQEVVSLTTLLDTTSLYHEAAYRGSAGELRAMLGAGAAVDALERGRSPLHLVGRGPGTEAEKLERVRALIAGGASVRAEEDNGVTPLHSFAFSGHARAVQALLEAGAAADAKDHHRGATALHLAAWAGRVETTRALLSAGASANLKDGRGATALHLMLGALGAPTHGREAEGARALLDGGASAEGVEEEDHADEPSAPFSPLHVAAMGGHVEAARVLLEAGASTEARDRSGRTPAQLAEQHGHAEAARVIRVGVSRSV